MCPGHILLFYMASYSEMIVFTLRGRCSIEYWFPRWLSLKTCIRNVCYTHNSALMAMDCKVLNGALDKLRFRCSNSLVHRVDLKRLFHLQLLFKFYPRIVQIWTLFIIQLLFVSKLMLKLRRVNILRYTVIFPFHLTKHRL